ncbi:tetratricopeptide repeat domain containing protein [Acanthamoeba castellanii str. Neff]|uniref:Tetratricopeptide repeat domain containing protein n=1 Tax=Acanthamoeba castellanii (strain ATCC 30010 / Neff) TaxID=1257118 RepID=L8GIF5_ACACF|nr:tetratricopeptide repeat domain containing protein [Acanthamoeba castellanii str. Neff]ELR12870.1 tetratricopeptide repeat domain containing protein [Acanthamoeba castellanii str. Neff]
MSTDDASSLNPAAADLDSLVAPEDAVAAPEGETKELAAFTISVKTLHGGSVSLQDVRQYLFETPEASDLTSYTLLLEGKPINDYAELSELPHLRPDSSLVMAPAAYNKRTSLLHIRRLREILSFHLVNFANTPSPSLFSHYCPADEEEETREPAVADQGTAAKGSKPAGGKKKNGGAQKPKAGGNESGNSSKAAATTAKGKRSEDLVDLKSPMSLQSFYPSVSASEPQCVKSIEFAGWNPPPGNRALLGDLYYLQVTTLEGATIFITSWTHGFYVNCCTETTFNPKPAPKSCSSHSLSGVLSQVSPQFKKNFQHVLKSGQFGRHPFELMPVPIPLTPWVGLDTPHVNDKNRAEYAVLYTEMDFAGNMRDWNEEYQACKELPSGTVQERIIRDRAVLKVHNDFVDAATRGAMYPPTPTTKDAAIKDEDKDKYAEQATYVSANNDLKGIRLYNDADVSGLGTVLTAVVDYRGYRLLAQSLIPGVLQREETNLAYGSMDNGKTVHADPQFHELMRKAALHMHIKEHELTDGSGNTAQLACPINAKGIVGTDGRRYLIDLGRATPLDTNWSDAPVETQQSEESGLVLHPSSEPLLRPELVSVFCDALELRLQHQGGDNPNLTIVLKEEAAAAEGESAKATTIDLSSAVKVIHDEPATAGSEKLVSEEVEQPSATVTKETKEEEEETEAKGQAEADAAAAASEEKKDGKRYVITINPNVLHAHANFTLTAPKEETEKDEALVKTLSAFLKDSILPRMAEEFVHLLSTPVDGQTLASIMHRNGINLRYLGRLANLCKGRPFLVRLCEQEMIVRAAKYEFNRYLRETEDHLLSFAISHFLNCLFGDAKALPEGVDLHTFEDDATAPDGASGHSNGVATTTTGGGGGGKKNKKNKGKGGETAHKSLATLPKAKIFALTSQQLWQTLQQLVQKRFGYDISLKGGAVIPRNPAGVDEATLNTRQRLRSLAGVRSFCQKVGIQVVARNYELSFNEPFKRRDILDVFPLVKHLNPKSKDGQQLLDAGKVFLGQGRLDVAFELFNEALAIFHQVYGPLHPDTALCYGNLAMVHYHANDTAQALVHQKKMVIINERVHGLDHHDTAHSYGNLALCLQRAHYLASLVCGPHHPDSPNTLMHMGTMYQDMGRAEVALKYYQEALKSNQYFFGTEENLQTGQICHCIALAHSTLDNFKEALNWEKKNYTILSNLLGEKDFRTSESNIWLKQFTRKAVQMQIEAKKAQRDITSNLSQEKFEKLTQQAGAARASAGGRGKKPASSSLPSAAQAKPAFKI